MLTQLCSPQVLLGGGRKLHPDCFRCSVCSASLQGTKHFEAKGGGLYCERRACRTSRPVAPKLATAA